MWTTFNDKAVRTRMADIGAAIQERIGLHRAAAIIGYVARRHADTPRQ
jgi:hypothetical protein